MACHMLRMRLMIVALMAITAVLASAPGAQAKLYCVGVVPPDCDVYEVGNPAGLQAALSAADNDGQSDIVRISGSTYQAPPSGFAHLGTDGIELVGAGPQFTKIIGPAGQPDYALNMIGSGSTSSRVRDLTVRAAATDGAQALQLTGVRGSDLEVGRASPPTGDATGVSLGADGSLWDSFVSIVGEAGTTAVRGVSGGSTVRNSRISSPQVAATAFSNVTSFTVERSSITAGGVGFSTSGSGHTGTIMDSTIMMTDGATGVGVRALNNATVNATNVTVGSVGSNPPPISGAFASAPGPGTSTLNLDSSTVRGFNTDIRADEQGGGNAVVNTSYSNYDVVGNGTGQVNEGAGNVDVIPGFVQPFETFQKSMDWHLLHSSPLVDAGNPAAPAPSVQDRDGLARVVDGDGAGGPRRDIGAYEYQRRPPVVALNGPASGQTGQTGQPLGYTSAGSSDPDRGDSLTYSWAFGDGSSGSGPSVSHAWAKAGVFGVKLTATDSAGVTAAATKPVSIVGPVLPPADTVAPVISRLSTQNRRFRITRRRTALSARRVKRGTAFRFRLSEPATVRISIERAASGRRRGRRCRRARGPIPRRRRCRRWVKTGGTIVRKNQAAGRRKVPFSGRFGRKRLSPGLHRASVRALDHSGNRSSLKRTRFRVVR